jgi:hypothetical protein
MQRFAQALRHRYLTRATLGRFWYEHGLALLTYALLAVALSWPTAQHFTTRITSDGGDAKHELSLLWHTQQVLLGRQPLYYAPLLYYPRGATLLTHATGPVVGLFALPFWPLSREAAYNGTLLVSLCLTGYCMYLLARGLGFERGVALFAGIVLEASPICLVGLNGHLTKVFLGLLPLALLALHRTLDVAHSRWWALAAGLVALATLMHNGFQFIFLGLAMGFFALAAIFAAGPNERPEVLRRTALAAACSLALAAPILIPTLAAARDPELAVTLNLESFSSPDLAEYVLPVHFSRFWGALTERIVQPFQPDIAMNLEVAVALSWAGLLLCLVALIRGRRPG